MTDGTAIFTYQERLDKLREDKLKIVADYTKLIKNLAKDKAIVREVLRQNIKEAQDGTKKNASMELMECFICGEYGHISFGEPARTVAQVYVEYVTLQEEERLLLHTIESYNTDIMALMSEMKFISSTEFKA
jgi:hypothetical protein